MQTLFHMIAKRKSMRAFDSSLTLSSAELESVRDRFKALVPLYPDIKTRMEIVPREQTGALFGQHALLLFSEPGAQALLNCGYMLEQMDLWFASQDIGACWYGMAKEANTSDGLRFIIMQVFGKSKPQEFRQDFSETRRRSAATIWEGDFDPRVIEAARHAPSATNSQPWRVTSADGLITVRRTTRYLTYMPPRTRNYFNNIDMGIFLLVLELALAEYGYTWQRELCDPAVKPKGGLVDVARYVLT